MRSVLVPLAVLGLLAFAPVASAQVSTDPAAVKPGAYAVEPMHTRIVFSVNHLGFTTYYGDFTGASGHLDLNPATPAASHVAISVPTASVSTTNSVLDGELKSADWLDAGQYPAITFTATAVEPTGATTAKIRGDLTLHGVTKPVTLDAKFNATGVNPLDKKLTVGFDAVTHIKRSDFGVSKYVPLVSDDVDVLISAAFEKVE